MEKLGDKFENHGPLIYKIIVCKRKRPLGLYYLNLWTVWKKLNGVTPLLIYNFPWNSKWGIRTNFAYFLLIEISLFD
jgi:hypothetical protein